jgi:cytochrome c biogenesis protein
MAGTGKRFEVNGVVGTDTTLSGGNEKLTLEFTGLRVINVENFAKVTPEGDSSTDVRKVDLVQSLENHLGSGAKAPGAKTLRNVGPSVTYKLRDASGQAREFHNYMVPVELMARVGSLAGVRDTPADQPHTCIPADEADSRRLDAPARSAADQSMREKVVSAYVSHAVSPANRARAAASRFRHDACSTCSPAPSRSSPGHRPPAAAVVAADFLETNVPESDAAGPPRC